MNPNIEKIKQILICLGLKPEDDDEKNIHGLAGVDPYHPHRKLFIRIERKRFVMDTRTFSVDRDPRQIANAFCLNGFEIWKKRSDDTFSRKSQQLSNEQKLLDRAMMIGLTMGLTLDDVMTSSRKDKGYRVELRNYDTDVVAFVYQDRVDITAQCKNIDTAAHMIRTATYAAQHHKRKAEQNE